MSPFEKMTLKSSFNLTVAVMSLSSYVIWLRGCLCLLGDKVNAHHQLPPAVQDTSSLVAASLNNSPLQLCKEEKENVSCHCEKALSVSIQGLLDLIDQIQHRLLGI